jgi:hypothetical protein
VKLSPWQWHKLVPRDMLANALYRKGILEAAETKQHIQQALLEVCKNDIIFWINAFGFQSNPDEMEEGPFICYPFQEAFFVGGEMEIGGVMRRQWGILECIEDREDLRVPKSRYVGASWKVAFTAVWLCLFHDHSKVLVMSKDEATAEDVDDSKSLFWKIQFIIDHLPDWMSRGSGKKKAGVMRFWNKTTITSTAKVISGGVGDRVTLMVLDEFGQFDAKAYEIYSMTKDAARSRVFIGTHKGRDTMLFTLCTDIRYAQMRETILHWSMHPVRSRGKYRYDERSNQIVVLDKSYEYPHNFRYVMETMPAGGPFPGIRSPWYDKTCIGRSEYDIAMNLDIDPTGSTLTFFDPYRIGQLKLECREPVWRGGLIHDKDTGMPKRLVADPKGKLKLWVRPVGEALLPNMRAGAGSDLAAGTGATPTCLSVFNAVTGDKVLAYEDATIDQMDAAMLFAAILRMISDGQGTNPLLCWEIQYSMIFTKFIRQKAGYRPIWISRGEDIPGRPRDPKNKAGLNSTKPSQLKFMDEYRKALYDQKITNWDEPSLDETLFYVYSGTGVEYKGRNKGRVKDAESGASVHHGDIVVADALAYKMICELGFGNSERITAVAKSVIPDPRSGAFREWLHEQNEMEREDDLVWA